MAKYKVRFYKDIIVEDVTNQNIAVMIASGENNNIPNDFSVDVELIEE